MKYKITALTFLTTICQLTWANNDRIINVDNHRPDEKFMQTTATRPTRSIQDIEPTSSINKQEAQVLTKAQLEQQPELTLQLLVNALKNNDIVQVELLTEIYQRTPQPDQELLQWAGALIAYHKGNLSHSIDLYRALLAKDPDQQAIRLQLAIALFKNKQNEAAQWEFTKLRSEPLPTPLIHLIDTYLTELNKQDQVQFYFSANYLQESNVNNAPKSGLKVEGFTPSSEPERATGVGYFANMHKNWSLAKGFFTDIDVDINGKYYWDNRKYNELSLQGQWGFGYRNLNHEIKIAPYIERLWYAGGEKSTTTKLKPYEKQVGLALSYKTWLNSNWKLSTEMRYAEQRHHQPEQHHANGNYYSLSHQIQYIPNSKQVWSLGLDYYRKNATLKANAFQRYAVSVGWAQEWLKGISTSLQLSYAQRQYKAASASSEDIFAPSFFKVRQQNKEYAIRLDLWKRDLHFFGITPRISAFFQKTKSNNPFAEYDRQRIYMTFSKTF
ncbi:surface lipoprotein assembly modifier [Pasteurellaceae bacterium 22721_9_1]